VVLLVAVALIDGGGGVAVAIDVVAVVGTDSFVHVVVVVSTHWNSFEIFYYSPGVDGGSDDDDDDAVAVDIYDVAALLLDSGVWNLFPFVGGAATERTGGCGDVRWLLFYLSFG
jgi:hypothetical protein